MLRSATRAIDSAALRIADPFDNTHTFQPLDGALRCRECDPKSVRHSSHSDEGICSQEFDYAQWIVA
jgi:hypothetical protein